MKKAAAPDIWSAAKDGNVKAVASAIESGVEVNAMNGNGMTPLMLVSLSGRTKVAEGHGRV
jgi:ankyrin repeat protein